MIIRYRIPHADFTELTAKTVTRWLMQEPGGNWFSNADGHYIKYQNSDSLKIVSNTADETCPDISKPTWENANTGYWTGGRNHNGTALGW